MRGTMHMGEAQDEKCDNKCRRNCFNTAFDGEDRKSCFEKCGCTHTQHGNFEEAAEVASAGGNEGFGFGKLFALLLGFSLFMGLGALVVKGFDEVKKRNEEQENFFEDEERGIYQRLY